MLRDGDASVTVVAGEYRGERSPAAVYTPLVGLEVVVPAGAAAALALRPDFEYGVLAVDGPASAGAVPGADGPGANIEPGLMAHLPTGVSALRLAPSGPDGGRFFVVGGEPFAERLVMWWNFVARTGEEIARFRADWAAGRFGEVPGGQASRWRHRRCPAFRCARGNFCRHEPPDRHLDLQRLRAVA